MLRITLITVGKIKEKYFKDACAEYEKRLSSLCSLKTVEIEPSKLPENPNPSQIESALECEAGKIISSIPCGAFVISMCIEGGQIDSESFSEKLDSLGITGKSNVCFIIGGSYGLSGRVKEHSDLRMSMSAMTFPHRLARIMLLEQIYRAFKISQGGTYHK